jgi:hypothetical protein
MRVFLRMPAFIVIITVIVIMIIIITAIDSTEHAIELARSISSCYRYVCYVIACAALRRANVNAFHDVSVSHSTGQSEPIL